MERVQNTEPSKTDVGRGESGHFAITRLTLTNYRNYEYLRVHTSTRPVIVTGANGVGKTNLLEAISLFSPGRGLRRARLGDLGRREEVGKELAVKEWGVVAGVEGPGGRVELATGIDSLNRRRRVVVDGKARTQSVLTEYSAVMWFTPQMDLLLVEGSSSRRRFLDHLVFVLFPSHAAYLSKYQRAMRERANLLRGRYNQEWMSSLEHIMTSTAMAIGTARLDVIQRLNRLCKESGRTLPAFQLEMEEGIEGALGNRSQSEVETWLGTELRKNRVRDAERGTTFVGPHRSDVQVSLCTLEKTLKPAILCSTGEQKILLLTLILTHARLIKEVRGSAPILLFDEILAYLDKGRHEVLFEELRGLDTQVWLTGNDEHLFSRFFEYADQLKLDQNTNSHILTTTS